MFVFLINIYISLFQKYNILTTSDDLLFAIINLILNSGLLVAQVMIISKMILKKFNWAFNLTNGIFALILMIFKLAGLGDFWKMKNKLAFHVIFLIIGTCWFGYLFAKTSKLEILEI